jgi:hypothetical protein
MHLQAEKLNDRSTAYSIPQRSQLHAQAAMFGGMKKPATTAIDA